MSGTAKTAKRANTRSKAAKRTSTGSKATSGGRARGGTRQAPVRRQKRAADRDRFEARRLAVERREGLRRLRLVIGLAAVTSLAVGVIAFVNSSWFDVDEIGVIGNDRAGLEAIVEASGVRIGQGLLEVDLDASARSIELVPWVGTATVSRSWTGSIEISVVERPPSAVIPAGGSFALVDDHGRQLEIVGRRPDGYLTIRGIEGSGVAGEAAPDEILPVVALVEALSDELTGRIGAVVVSDGEIHLELAGGGRASLGDGVDLGAKLQAFETVLARVDLACLDTIDVRVPAAPVVTRTAELPPLDGDLAGSAARNAGTEEPDSTPVDC